MQRTPVNQRRTVFCFHHLHKEDQFIKQGSLLLSSPTQRRSIHQTRTVFCFHHLHKEDQFIKQGQSSAFITYTKKINSSNKDSLLLSSPTQRRSIHQTRTVFCFHHLHKEDQFIKQGQSSAIITYTKKINSSKKDSLLLSSPTQRRSIHQTRTVFCFHHLHKEDQFIKQRRSSASITYTQEIN